MFFRAARPQNSCNFAVSDNGLRVAKHDVAVICHPEAAQLDSWYARVGLPTDSAFLFGVFVGKRQCFLQSPIGNKMHAELLYGSAESVGLQQNKAADLCDHHSRGKLDFAVRRQNAGNRRDERGTDGGQQLQRELPAKLQPNALPARPVHAVRRLGHPRGYGTGEL